MRKERRGRGEVMREMKGRRGTLKCKEREKTHVEM
jgi:hypothetical protein